MILLNLIFSFLLFWTPLESTNKAIAQIDPILSAIESGSSSELARFFNPSIALNINGQQGDYSRTQAELVLREFFKKNPPIGFSLVFKNENPKSHSTYVGEYAADNGNFKVFIKASQADNGIRVYSLDFVKS